MRSVEHGFSCRYGVLNERYTVRTPACAAAAPSRRAIGRSTSRRRRHVQGESMKSRSILISGAGIVGTTLAYWLPRFGFQPTVVERAPGLRAGGHAVDIRGTARTVAERTGIVPQARQSHTGAQSMAFLDHSGKRAATLSTEVFEDSGGPIAEMAIRRRTLNGSCTTRRAMTSNTSSATRSPISSRTAMASGPVRIRRVWRLRPGGRCGRGALDGPRPGVRPGTALRPLSPSK